MFDLQAVVQAFGKEGKNRVKAKKAIAPTWIIVTSQEKLDEVVNLLDSSRIEMARLKDRFPISIDLEPTDISEITRETCTSKNPRGRKRTRRSLYQAPGAAQYLLQTSWHESEYICYPERIRLILPISPALC